MRILSIVAVAMFLVSCVSGYQTFYKPYVDAKSLTNIELLQPGQEPKVFGTNDFKKDIKILRSKRYIPIGYSSFNGKYEDESMVKAQAKRVGATIVLVNTKYTNTQTSTLPLFMPNSSTTYSSGSVYGGGVYGGYSGTSTTYGTTVVPITTQQRRYDQAAVFFVKSTKKFEFGVFVNNLSDTQRNELERNTGAIIDVVVEGTPAFYANILPGDILIKINGVDVRDANHAIELMKEVSSNNDEAVFTVLRKGKKKDILIKLNKT